MDKLITYLAEYTDIDEGEIKGTSEWLSILGWHPMILLRYFAI